MSYLIRRVLAKPRLILDEMCRLYGKFASYFSSYKWLYCLRQVCVDPILERNVKISALSVPLAFSIVIILRRSKSVDQTKVIKESKLDALETRISILPLSFKFENKARQLFQPKPKFGIFLHKIICFRSREVCVISFRI